LDPPFRVGTGFGARTKANEWRARNHAHSGPLAYADTWPCLEGYLSWLVERCDAVWQTLKASGTLWLHLDHRSVHHAKVALDRHLGHKRFAGEVIWLPGNGVRTRRGPGASHQTILIYARTAKFLWNGSDPALRAPYAATSLSMHFTHVDGEGRRYRERVLGGKTYRYYADVGRALGSVWDDCPAMVANTPLRGETTGYPTQKPERLLERIVRAASGPGDVVFDPFCGSGTTLVAAARLGRTFVGSDIGALAIEVTSTRLLKLGVEFARRAHERPPPSPAAPRRRLTGVLDGKRTRR
jgi:site-specific DNA-methyltransferase (adenine-specific)